MAARVPRPYDSHPRPTIPVRNGPELNHGARPNPNTHVTNARQSHPIGGWIRVAATVIDVHWPVIVVRR